jgi:hypothetical protein
LRLHHRILPTCWHKQGQTQLPRPPVVSLPQPVGPALQLPSSALVSGRAGLAVAWVFSRGKCSLLQTRVLRLTSSMILSCNVARWLSCSQHQLVV